MASTTSLAPDTPPPEAFYDLYYLLARGYPREQALQLVAVRYRLTREQTILLNRCIHPPHVVEHVKRILHSPEAITGNKLAIDGFNQLTTIYAAATRHPTYRCADGIVRDNMLAGPRYVTQNIDMLIEILEKTLKTLKPEETIVILDSQPSWSGKTAAKMREKLGVQVQLSKTADKTVIEYGRKGYIVASSDITILLRIERAFDLAGYTINKILGIKVNNIPHLLNQQHQRWCRAGP